MRFGFDSQDNPAQKTTQLLFDCYSAACDSKPGSVWFRVRAIGGLVEGNMGSALSPCIPNRESQTLSLSPNSVHKDSTP